MVNLIERPIQPKPSIGRIVHCVLDDGTERPSIIVNVFKDMTVNLQVFMDSDAGNLKWARSAHYDSDGALGTWHWQWDCRSHSEEDG